MFNRINFLVSLILFPLCIFGTIPDAVVKERMLTNLESIRNTFQSQYAPLEWKANYVGWLLEVEIALAKAKIEALSPVTVKGYQRILKEFFDSIHDYHASITFSSTESAHLPFLIKSANGHYYIVDIDRQTMPKGGSSFQIGDEIIAVNDQPIEQAIQEFLNRDFNEGKTLTDRTFGEIGFTYRSGAQGHQVPNGSISFKVKHLKMGVTKNHTMNWIYQPEQIAEAVLPSMPKLLANMKADEAAFEQVGNLSNVFRKPMLTPSYHALKEHPFIASKEGLGSKKSFLPTLGKKIWETGLNSHFYAYICELDKKKIGYLRIPHYMGTLAQIDQFKNLISRFQRETDALVIDQLNNPGGLVFYMYTLASMLTDQPLILPKHAISITQKEVLNAIEALTLFEQVQTDEDAQYLIGDLIDGYPATAELAKKIASYFSSIIHEWNSGRTITQPMQLWGIDQLDPHPDVNYTKPILVLINQLDLSCADQFPALLKDNNRATLFGAPTAGAGGFVLGVTHPNLFGVESYTYTGSLAQRLDDSIIENRGVSPDISYIVTEKDLTKQYSSYASAVQNALKSILKLK